MILLDAIPYVEALKWPALVLVCFAVVLIMFKDQIRSFLSRVDSIGKEGLKATPATPTEQQAKQDLERQKKQGMQELSQALSSPTVRDQENLIKVELEKKGLQHSGETVDILVTYLAHTFVWLQFEQAYKSIFGSQIHLLKVANTKGPFTQDELVAHFAHVRRLFAPSFDGLDPDRYVAYLIANALLVKQNNTYLITNRGKEFLQFIIGRGYTETPPL